MPPPMIKVFWDLASCPPPASYGSLAEILKDVRRFTSNFGSVTSIKAYWDRNNPPLADANATGDSFRVAMLPMGISLIDGASMPGYTGDALTRMLTVDVLVSAMDDLDRLERDIIMIISGAESMLYPISLLMFRNHTVFLVVPDESNMQSFQATRVFSWCTDVLGIKSSPNPEPTVVIAEEPSKFNGWVLNGNHIPQLDLSNMGTPSPSNRPARSAPQGGISSPKPTTTTTTTPATTPKTENRPVPASEPPVSRTHSVLSSNSEPPTNKRVGVAQATSSPKPSALGPPRSKVPSQAPESPDALATSTMKLGDNPNDDWGQFGGNWSTGGGWEMTGLSWSDEPVTKPSKMESRKVEPETEQEAKPIAPKNPQPGGTGSRSAQEAKKPTPKPEPKPPVTKAPNNPPMSVFGPLLAILRTAENQSMLKSQVGRELAKQDSNRKLYQNAGVGGLGEYLALAGQKNLVTLCGVDNHQQVKLKNSQRIGHIEGPPIT